MKEKARMEIPSSPPLPNSIYADAAVECSLPMDMIFNILLRLPVKSLCKFKCVSRKFLELIRDPYFISMHREICMSNPNILLVKKVHDFVGEPLGRRLDFCGRSSHGFCKKFEFSMYIEDPWTMEMLASKGGLICFRCESGFYACNPSRQAMVKLPAMSYPLCVHAHASGMEYIKERDEYVLVHLFGRSNDPLKCCDFGCEVLRLRDGMDCSWKVVDANCPYYVKGRAVLVENVFYWMAFIEHAPRDELIVSFDLVKQEFNPLSPPEVWFQCGSLVELGGRLCFSSKEPHPRKLDIWVLKDIQNHKWVLEYSIRTDGFPPRGLQSIIPLDYRDGKILMDVNKHTLEYYDTKIKKFIKTMRRQIGERRKPDWDCISIYTESFFSLNQIGA